MAMDYKIRIHKRETDLSHQKIFDIFLPYSNQLVIGVERPETELEHYHIYYNGPTQIVNYVEKPLPIVDLQKIYPEIKGNKYLYCKQVKDKSKAISYCIKDNQFKYHNIQEVQIEKYYSQSYQKDSGKEAKQECNNFFNKMLEDKIKNGETTRFTKQNIKDFYIECCLIYQQLGKNIYPAHIAAYVRSKTFTRDEFEEDFIKQFNNII